MRYQVYTINMVTGIEISQKIQKSLDTLIDESSEKLKNWLPNIVFVVQVVRYSFSSPNPDGRLKGLLIL